MKIFTLSLFLLFCLNLNAQNTADYPFLENVTFDTPKSKVIEITLNKLRAYLTEDVGGIQKKLKQNYGVNINKKNLSTTIDKIVSEYKEELTELDKWSDSKLHYRYHIEPASLLGHWLKMPGFPNMNTEGMNDGYLALEFQNGRIKRLIASAKTASEIDIFSGYPYNENQIKNAERTATSIFGPVKRQTSTAKTYQCSPAGHTTYDEIFNYDQGNLRGYYSFAYYITVRKISNNECQAIGNHLSKVVLSIMRETANDKDFKERN